MTAEERAAFAAGLKELLERNLAYITPELAQGFFIKIMELVPERKDA